MVIETTLLNKAMENETAHRCRSSQRTLGGPSTLVGIRRTNINILITYQGKKNTKNQKKV